MKISVIINNYNNERFLLECVESALTQTYQPCEVIIVDDESTDHSVPLLQKNYGSHPLVKIIQQRNQGQLGAIATGLESATGDVVAFLDGDDTYKPGYLFELQKTYQENPKVDFVFSRPDPFGIPPYTPGWLPEWLEEDYDFGYSSLLAYFSGHPPHFGSCTIALSLKRTFAGKLYLREANQIGKTGRHADNAINMAVGLLRGRKFYMHKALVNYRHHENNYWANNHKFDGDTNFISRLTSSAWLNFYRTKCYYTEDSRKYLLDEMATIPKPHKEHLALYHKILHPKDQMMVKGKNKTRWLKTLERKIRAFRKRIVKTESVPDA